MQGYFFVLEPSAGSYSEELRRHQGHHRAPAGSACVDLYSRDDIHPALELQRIVRAKHATGFRPVVPVVRGVGIAVKDLPVSIPALPEALAVDAQTSIQLDSAELHVDTDSNASEGEDLPETGDSSVPQVPHLSHDISDCVFFLNDVSYWWPILPQIVTLWILSGFVHSIGMAPSDHSSLPAVPVDQLVICLSPRRNRSRRLTASASEQLVRGCSTKTMS